MRGLNPSSPRRIHTKAVPAGKSSTAASGTVRSRSPTACRSRTGGGLPTLRRFDLWFARTVLCVPALRGLAALRPLRPSPWRPSAGFRAWDFSAVLTTRRRLPDTEQVGMRLPRLPAGDRAVAGRDLHRARRRRTAAPTDRDLVGELEKSPEPHTEALAVRAMGRSLRHVKRRFVEALQQLEHRPVLVLEKPPRNVNHVVR